MNGTFAPIGRLSLLAVLLLMAGLASAATLTVPGDYGTIQLAVDAAAPGDVIDIASGTYTEQVRVTTADLVLTGAGTDQTIILSPAILDESFVIDTVTFKPVVFADGVDGLQIENLTVDGNDQGTANDLFVGIAFWNAGGGMQDVRVTNVSEEPAGTTIRCEGIYANNDTEESYTLVLDGVQVDEFQRVGIDIRGASMTATLSNTDVTGRGQASPEYQNGIQFVSSTGFVDECTVTDANYVGSFASLGVGGFSGADVTITNSQILRCYIASVFYDGEITIDECEMSGAFCSDAVQIRTTSAEGPRKSDRKRVNGLLTGSEPRTRSTAEATITNSEFVGTDLNYSWGVYVGGPGVATLTVRNCRISQFNEGVVIDPDPTGDFTVVVNENIIENNVVNNVWTGDDDVADLSGNWFGSAEINPSILTTIANRNFIDFTPFVASGEDISPDPGVQLDLTALHAHQFGAQLGDVWRIQEAVDYHPDTDTVIVEAAEAAGVYYEQVHITRDGMTLQGRNGGVIETTFLSQEDPADLPRAISYEGNDYHPIIFVDGATDVTVENIFISGGDGWNGPGRIVGVGYWNASGEVNDMYLASLHEQTYGDPYSGIGIFAATDDSAGPLTVACARDTLQDYQRGGVVFLGSELTGIVSEDLFDWGPWSGAPVHYGIEYGAGASGLVSGLTMSGYTASTFDQVSAAVLASRAGLVEIENVELDANSWSFILEDGAGSFHDSQLYTGVGGSGIQIVNTDAGPLPGQRQALPIVPREPGGGPSAPTSMVIDNSLLESAFGVSLAVGDQVNVEMTGSTMVAAQTGILLPEGGAPTGFINRNDFSENYLAIEGSTETPFDATCNWWGSVDGPNATSNPSDGSDIDSNVNFAPWLDGPGGECNGGVVADVVTIVPPDGCGGDGCSLATVSFDRGDTDPLRGVSVTFTLSEELALCTGDPSSDITALAGAGALFEGYANLAQEVIANGGGSYTVDVVLTGDPCGPTTGGDVFTIALTAAEGAGDVTGTITVTAVDARDCDNQPLPGSPGEPAEVIIDGTPPAAITDLTATLGEAGSSPGTTQVLLSWTAPTDPEAETIEIWRRGYGDHPEYDDGTGTPATTPVSTDNGWILVDTVAAAATGYTDDPGARDYWSYAVKTVDACGNASPVADEEIAGGILDYHLGDVIDPADAAADGDNLVDMADVSRLGASYGTADGDADYLNTVDIGPTTDLGVLSLPTTDDLIDFEDLMVMAMNFGLVGRLATPEVAAMSTNAIWAEVSATGPRPGTIVASVMLRGDGRIQGLSAPLRWNAEAVTPVDVAVGGLMAEQSGMGIVLSPRPGTVDVALLGARERGLGLRGEGTLARVVFEFIGEGEPNIAVGEATARDLGNKPVFFGQETTDPIGAAELAGTGPAHTGMGPNHPNPFNPSTTLSFSLQQPGRVRLGIYDLRGRLVSSLVDGPLARGDHSIVWQGRDDTGKQVSSGTYFVRLVAPDHVETRTITLVK